LHPLAFLSIESSKLQPEVYFSVTEKNTCLKLLIELQRYFMTLDVKPEIAAALEALASTKGLSVEDYLQQLVEKELPLKPEDGTRSEGSGMVRENGVLVYRTGRPLPWRVIEDTIRQVREERAQHILGKHS
jgi:hypothetical protein